jgi:predicted ATPase
LKRYILTGAPGSGKTAIIRWLETEGCAVVEEAATDVIALEAARGNPEPHTQPSFIDAIVDLQVKRLARSSDLPDEVQFHDRSPICTYALSLFLGFPISARLAAELERIEAQAIYQRRVFFIRNLGFITSTEARRISFEEALRFERVHEDAYGAFGYDCVYVDPAPLVVRVDAVRRDGGLR